MPESTRLLDINVLVAMSLPDHVHHEPAHRWYEGLPAGTRWATCSVTEMGYLRLMANPAVTGDEYGMPRVLAVQRDLDELPGHTFLADPTSLANSRLDLDALVGSKQVTDFHLVNLAATSNAVLATFDRRLVEALSPADRVFTELIPV